MMRYIHFGWVIVAACLTFSGCREKTTLEFTILQLNDVYEFGPLEAGKSGGLARVSSVFKELKQENPNTIMVLCGDFLSPSLIGTLKDTTGKRIKGAHMIEVFNQMGLNYATFGNHEIDLEEEELKARINESEFQWVSSNVRNKTPEGKIIPFTHTKDGMETPIPDFVLHTFKFPDHRTLTVGMLGVTLPFNLEGYVEYLEVTASAKKVVDILQEQCDLPLALTHLERVEDLALAPHLDVPLMMGGHNHTHMIDTVGGTVITKADANAKTVYIHQFTYDEASKTSAISSILKKIDDRIPEDSATLALIEKWKSFADKQMVAMGFDPYEVITTVDYPLDGLEYDVRQMQTNLGTLIAHAYMDAYPQAEAAIVNSGSIRVDDHLSGVIMQYDILRTLPFGGEVVLADIPGDILIRALDQGEKNMHMGSYLQRFNLSQNEDKEWMIGKKMIHPGTTYKIAAPVYLLTVGDKNLEFLMGLKYESPDKIGSEQNIPNDCRDMVIEYLRSGGR